MAVEKTFALKGHIIFSKSESELCSFPDHFLVCENARVAGVYNRLPDQYAGVEVTDWGEHLIVPGMADLHVHAPQYAFRGLGMDLELLEWLECHTFPEERRYSDLAYAKVAYADFVDGLKRSSTTRACVFATIHTPSTLLLMQMMEAAGLAGFVGRVNMDMNSPADYMEKTADSLEKTEAWIRQALASFGRVKPILTPRFAPVCTGELMAGLGKLQQKYGLALQSHLSENPSEVAWVKSLFPDSRFYGDVYDRFGIFGDMGPVVMAHCIYCGEAEQEKMLQKGVYVAHCPQSNANLSSGIAPVGDYLKKGMKMGLGSDIAGGATLSIMRAATDAIQMSKMYWRLVDSQVAPLTFAQAFYLATRGGGSFFGRVGSFEPGYEFDAVVLSDDALPPLKALDCESRLERLFYLADGPVVAGKYVMGQKIL